MCVIFILDDEQPTTCPKCGARTDFKDLDGEKQEHVCLGCGFKFIGEFENDST